MLDQIRHLFPRSLLRYAIVGVVQNGVFYLFGLALIAFGWQAWQIVLVMNPLAVVATFLANRYWSFSERRDLIPRAALGRYVVAYGVAYPVAMTLAYGIERLGVPGWLTLLLTIGIAAVGLYLALNFWVFRQSEARSAAPAEPGGPPTRP